MATLSKASNRSLSTDETQSWRWNSSQMILLLTLPCVSATSWFVNIWDEDCMTLDDLSCIKVCQRKMIACKLVFSCNIPTRAIFFSWLLPLSLINTFGKFVWLKVATNVLWWSENNMSTCCESCKCAFSTIWSHLWRKICTYVINIFRRAMMVKFC